MSNYPQPPSYNVNPDQRPPGSWSGYSPSGQMGYPPQGQMGHSHQSQTGYPQQSQMGYPQQSQMGYPQQSQSQTGYPQQSQMGYPQQSQSQTGYPQQSQMGYPQQGQMNYPQQGQMGFSQHGQVEYSPQSQMGQPSFGPSGQSTPVFAPQGQMGYPPQGYSGQPGGSMDNTNPYYTGRPTVLPITQFNPTRDSEILRKAVKNLGTDEDSIIGVLSKRSFEQRQEIVKNYRISQKRDLINDLKDDISGKFERVVLLSLKGLPGLLASSMKAAISGAGTDEMVLIQCLVPYKNWIIREANNAYQMMTGRRLESSIKGDTSGNFEDILVDLIQANRDESIQVDMNLVRADADKLYSAGEGRMGTNEKVFNQILSKRSFTHIKALSQTYAQQYGKPLITAIEKETSGNYRKTLVSIVRFAEDKNTLLAEWLFKSMYGMGTKDESLMLLVLGRSEIDLADIKEAYQRKYDKSLARAIEKDTSGYYQKMLLALVGN